MPLLARLHQAGFSIWPVDSPGWPRVVEIYPRVLTGRVNKSDRSTRSRYVEQHCRRLADDVRRKLVSSGDARSMQLFRPSCWLRIGLNWPHLHQLRTRRLFLREWSGDRRIRVG